MEKIPLRTNYTVHTKVTRVFQQFESQYICGMGQDAEFKKLDMGWFVAFEGSHEALFFGFQPPPWNVGDRVKITFEKVS